MPRVGTNGIARQRHEPRIARPQRRQGVSAVGPTRILAAPQFQRVRLDSKSQPQYIAAPTGLQFGDLLE